MSAGCNWEKVRSLFGQVLRPEPGTKAFTLACLLIAASTLPTACALLNRDKEQEEAAAAKAAEEEAAARSADNSPYPHPQKATAWDTQVLLMTNPQPPFEELQACQAELIATAKEANQETAILQARDQFTGRAKALPVLYHWCFYNAMFALDTSILQQGITLRDRTAMFLDTMKQLWILASALDHSQQRQHYLPYLRLRYIEMSQAVFGRNLTIVGLPLGGLPPAPSTAKPQGEARTDE